MRADNSSSPGTLSRSLACPPPVGDCVMAECFVYTVFGHLVFTSNSNLNFFCTQLAKLGASRSNYSKAVTSIGELPILRSSYYLCAMVCF